MWHYSFDGKAQGPTAESSVIQLIQSGQINKDTLVWRDGMANWAALHSTELAKHLPVAQAPIYNPYQAPNSVPQVRSSAHVPLTWGQIFWSFEGRIPRRQFWAATGILYAVILAIFLIGWLIGEATDSILAIIPVALGFIAVFISSLAIQIKRWHDRGYSGAMVLINFVPLLGIWTFVECGCLRGTVGDNNYGSDPT